VNSAKNENMSGKTPLLASEPGTQSEESPAKTVTVADENAPDRTTQMTAAKIRQQLHDRLEKLTREYTLGLDTQQADIFNHLQFLNENFFFDRPIETSELAASDRNPLTAAVVKTVFPLLRRTLSVVFARQRGFNGELVKLLNRLFEVLGNQRDYNRELISFCERTIEHSTQFDVLEKRLDDYFSYVTRVALAEEDIASLRKRVDQIEQGQTNHKPGKKKRK